MIPIGDENSCKRGSAVVTWSIIGINVAVFVFIQGFGSNVQNTLALAAVPSEIALGHNLLALLTSQFAHAGIAHIAGNMLFLGVFGDNVECRIGRARYLALYLISGTIGILAHIAAANAIGGAAAEAPLIGASAAISGILAAYLVLFPGNRVTVLLFNFIPTALSAWIVIGFWFLLQVVGGLSGISSGGVAYIAHIAGFVSSWLWSRRYKKREREKIEQEKRQRLLRNGSGGSDGIRWWIVDDDN